MIQPLFVEQRDLRDRGFALRFPHRGQEWNLRETVVGSTVERASPFVLAHPAPLFKEERHGSALTLISNGNDPFALERPSPRAALAADDHPFDSRKIEVTEILEQWLDGKKSDCGRSTAKMLHP